MTSLTLRARCGLGLLLAIAVATPSCAQRKRTDGTIRIDGSSTVYPIMVATAELFKAQQPRIAPIVGVSGTGGGFKKFLEDQPALRTDIANASRPIKPTEVELAAQRGVEFIELAVALDGMAIVVNPAADFVDYLTVAELTKIWQADSTINSWKDVREGFPDVPLKLFGPGPDSGTYDYFVEAVLHAGKSRSDYTANENDNVLVQGVANEKGGLGYFGFAYYHANADRLRIVPIENPRGERVTPTVETIRTGQYTPLSRPLFIYVNASSAKRPELQLFIDFFFSNAGQIVEHPKVSYVSLSDDLYDAMRKRFAAGVTGTLFAEQLHRPLDEAYGVKAKSPE